MGRNSGIMPPPSMGEAGGHVSDLISADDLAAFAGKAGLKHARDADLVTEAAGISVALNFFAIFDRARDDRAPPTVRRDWCRQVERQARELLFALGLASPRAQTEEQFSPYIHATAALMLHAWPNPLPDKGPDRATLGILRHLAWLAAPERRDVLSCRHLSKEPALVVLEDEIQARLPPLLDAISLLARWAAEHHGAEVRHKGRRPERARAALFRDLAGHYRRLFGSFPGVSSRVVGDGPETLYLRDGPAFRWYSALLDRTKAHALERLHRGELDQHSRGSAACLGSLIKLADEARGPSSKGHALAEWIRQGSKEAGKLAKAQPPQPETVELMPLEDILSGQSD